MNNQLQGKWFVMKLPEEREYQFEGVSQKVRVRDGFLQGFEVWGVNHWMVLGQQLGRKIFQTKRFATTVSGHIFESCLPL